VACLLVVLAVGLAHDQQQGIDSEPDWEFLFGNRRFNLEHAIERASKLTSGLKGITRDEVMTRAREWVDKKIPYCQCNGPAECCGSCPYCKDYRCDCSGYVSYTWGLPYGYNTNTLPDVSHPIEKDELREGDVLLNRGDHVILFGGWADAHNTTYHAYQEPGCHTDGPHYAYVSTTRYPSDWSPELFKPYRFDHIA
jgi:hypothetical protein